MSKPLSYYADLVKNANTDDLASRVQRQRQAYLNSINTGGTQESAPIPVRQQVSLPGVTNNQLSNAILMPNNVQVKANQELMMQGLQPAYLGQAPTVTQEQPLSDPTGLHRIASGASGVVKSMAATIPMFVDTTAQTLENRSKDSQNHFYRDAYKEYQNLYNLVEDYKKKNPDSVRTVTKQDPTDPRGVRQITETEYSSQLQALMNQLKDKETFMNLQRDTTPVASNSLGMEMYRDANKDKEYALQGLDETGRFIGSTLMSIGQNALTLPFAAVNPLVPLGMMSANAASDRMGELNEQRVSAGEALGRGVLAGGIEAATEKVSLENLLDIAKTAPKSLKEAVVRTLQQSGTEASEEAVSYALNALADYAADDPEAEFNIRGLLESSLGGALSGGLMGGGANLVGYAKGQNVASFDESKPAIALPVGEQLTEHQGGIPNLPSQQINSQNEFKQPSIPFAKQQTKAIPLAPDYAAQLIGQDTYNTLQQIAQKANTTVSIVQGKGYNGYYQDGRIYINANSDKPVLTTMKHELTHHLETSEYYNALQQMMMNEYSKTSKHGVDKLVEAIQEDYANYGVNLSNEDARHEFAAKYVEEKLFTDEASVKKLYQEQPNLFKRVYEWIKDTIKYVRSSKEQRALMDIEKLYVKAMNDTSQRDTFKSSNTSYSFDNKSFNDIVNQDNVIRMEDGTYAFKVDFEMNQGNTLTQKNVRDIIKSLGPQIVTLDGDVINITSPGASEYVYGTSSKSMYADTLNKKMNLAGSLEDAIKTSNYEYTENNIKQTGKSGLLAPDGFDKRTARIIDKSGNAYELNLVIGINQNTRSPYFGKNFYDVSNIKTSALKSVSAKGSTLHSADVTNNISNNSESVKTDMQIALEKAGLIDSNVKQSIGKSLSEHDTNRSKLEERVSGDDLLDAQDLIEEIKAVNGDIDENGYVTVYHRTNAENAKRIKATKSMVAKEDGLFFSTKENGQNEGYGDTVIKLSIPVEKLMLDDLFYDEAHLRLPLGNKRKLYVGDYLSDVRQSMGKTLSEYEQLLSDQKGNSKTIEHSNNVSEKTRTIQDAERRSLTQLSKQIQDVFGISRSDVNNELKADVLKLKEAIQTTGKIDSEMADVLFDKAWNLGQSRDTTMYELYPELSTSIKEAGLDIDLAKRALGATAYNDYRFEAKKLVGMQKGGRSIDSYYNELANTYPELFDESVNNEADQLYAILNVADELQPRNKSLNDTDAKLYKEGYRQDFHKALNDYLTAMERYQSISNENKVKSTLAETMSYDEYNSLMSQINGLERDYNRVMREPFTQKEKTYADLISKGQLDYADVKNANIDNIRKIVEVKQPLEKARKAKSEYRKSIKNNRIEKAKRFIESMPMWKEKKQGFLYSMETAERNILDVVGNNDEGKAMNEAYITPIHISEAARNKFMNFYRDRIRNLNLTSKESEVVQRYGEGDMSAEDVVKFGFDLDKINHAVEEFKGVYSELLNKMNEVLVKNGYNPIQARENYFPHFLEQNDGTLETIKRLLNPKNDLDNLGTSLAGITETFRPGKQFFANTLQRHSDKTVFDAVRGFDNYIDGVSNVIYHTDNIQNLRALEETIRYQNSDEGIKARIDEINNDGELSEDERQSRINELFRDKGTTGKFGEFVSWLNRYTNNLAGKKSVEDRTWEYNMGRGMYRLSKNLSNKVAGNMVAINPSSWATNFIPIAQATGECSPQNISKAMYDVVTNKVVSDDFNARSTFMTNRLGSENLYKTNMQKIIDKLSSPMQLIDNFTSEVVTRAKYYQNLENGMTETEAMKNADAYAAGLIADRSKGAMPTLFNIKNPITKAFTQFQLEQNNQLRYLFKDLPRAKQDEAVKALLIALFSMAGSQWLFNNVYEAFFGRRPALDPIDMAFNTWGVLNDSDLKNSEKATTIMKDVGGEVPFIGGLLGGGRLPINGAIPTKPSQLLDIMDPEMDDRKKLDVLYNQLIKPASYFVLPFGAGQLNKTGKGLHDFVQGAAYQYTDDGDKLKYTIDQNPLNFARGLIGGSSAFPEARDYWEGDYKTLSVKDTDTFQLLKETLDNKTALEKVYELKAIESLKDENGKSIVNSKSYYVKEAIDKLPISDVEKQELYNKYGVSKTVQDMDKSAYEAYRKKIEKEMRGSK